MARQILPIAGAIIGSAFGAPQLGFAIGSIIGNAVDPLKVMGPKVGDLQIQTSRDGVPRPIVYGVACVAGNIIDRTNPRIVKKKERAGKGGPVTITERAYLSFAVRICEGPAAGISRVWENEKLVYDVTPGSTIPNDSAKFASKVTFYLGDETQMPDPTLEAFHGVGNTPAYRGTCYAVVKDKDVTDTGGAISQYRFEIAAVGTMGSAGQWLVTDGIGYSSDLLEDGIWTEVVNDLSGGIRGVGFKAGDYFYAQNPPSTAALADLTDWTALPGWSTANVRGYASDGSYVYIARGNYILGRVPFPVGTMTTPNVTADSYAETLAVFDGDLYIFATIDNRCHKSSDQGATYTTMTAYRTIGTATDTPMAVAGPTGIAVAYSDNGGAGPVKVTFTSDGANTWSSPASPVSSDSTLIGLIRTASKYFIMSGAGNCARSDDGLTWVAGTAISGGVTAMGHGNEIVVCTKTDGTMVQSADYGATWTAFTGPTASDNAEVYWTGDPAAEQVFVGGTETLASIVTSISDRIGVGASKLNVTELTDAVTGFVVGGSYSAADVLRSLQKAYFFDPVEIDGKIVFRKRGAAVVASIDETQMVDTPEESIREQELEFPKKLHLAYQNADIGYAPTQANAQRNSPDVRVVTEVTLDVPVVLNADQAAQIADKMIKVSWIDALGEIKFQIPDNYSYLTPTDCVTLTYRGRAIRVRIERMETVDGIISVTARQDRQSAYGSAVTGLVPPAQQAPVETSPGDTYFQWMNIPALIDQDDRLGYYVIAAGELPGWSGAVVQRAIDAGANYIEIDTIGTGCQMGILTQTLPSASEYATDTTNKLTVQLYGPTSNDLESISQTQFLQDYNAALVGDEIIQFKTATEISPGIWELTTLNRGRLATTVTSHAIGERFVMLEGAHFIETTSANIGQSLTHRAVAYTTDPTLATPVTAAWTPARSQLEFAPVDLVLSKNGNILTASWTPRHRFGTAITPVASVNFEGFDIQIVGSSTISLTTTLSTITQDITGLGTVTVTVAGKNRITGVSTLTASGVI